MNLLNDLLIEQQTLTAVEQFSQDHTGLPAQAKYYSKLLPASPPEPGQQYAFDVDLDRCSGCKACVTACHQLNGLDENETWRDVGLLIGGTEQLPVIQHVTTACHHCLEPGCLDGCPVNAYEKDPTTGIVKHLDDQCFGCQYCTMTCPYEVPQYHATKGIVRKCDMCSDRLSDGEAPACVQACPHEAISITLVDIGEVKKGTEFPATAPDSNITKPTTQFRSKRTTTNAHPIDIGSLKLQHAHWPLIVMLVLTQLSVGALVFSVVDEATSPHRGSRVQGLVASSTTVAVIACVLGLIASTLHLGRPQYAFRAILGFRHSWLSREIVAFGIFASALIAYAVMPNTLLLSIAIAAGLAGVFCSVKLYAFTKREFWAFWPTLVRFGLTMVILGMAATCSTTPTLIWKTAFVLACLCRITIALWSASKVADGTSPLSRTAKIMLGPLRSVFVPHIAALVIAVAFTIAVLPGASARPLSWVLLAICLVAEFAGRYLFFRAVSPARMPGSAVA